MWSSLLLSVTAPVGIILQNLFANQAIKTHLNILSSGRSIT